MKYPVLSSLLAVAAATTAITTAGAAITVTGNNLGGAGRLLADASGTLLPTGSLIRVGYFDDAAAQASVLASYDYGAINELFKPLAEGLANAGTLSTGTLSINATAGRFSFEVINVQQSYLPAGKLMFYWVFNSPTPAAADQWALFTNDDDSGDGAPWLSNLDDPLSPGSGDISLAVQQLRVDDASDVITGTLVDNQLRLAPVPEPGLTALLLAALPLFARRRRA